MVQSNDSQMILKENYQPTTYPGKAPEPLPKVTEDLPWVQLSKKEEQLQQKAVETAQKASDKKEELEEKKQIERGGTISSLVGAAADLFHKVSHKVGQNLHELGVEAIQKLEEAQKTRLQERFNANIGEELMYEYTCSIIEGDQSKGTTKGSLYVTTKHLGFWSDCGDYKMRIWFPLENIVSLQPGKTMTKKEGEGVFVQRIESCEASCDSILVYTKDSEVYKFYNFGVVHDPINSYWSHAWNVLDHAWRDSNEDLKKAKQTLNNQNPWEKGLEEQKQKEEKDSSSSVSNTTDSTTGTSDVGWSGLSDSILSSGNKTSDPATSSPHEPESVSTTTPSINSPTVISSPLTSSPYDSTIVNPKVSGHSSTSGFSSEPSLQKM